MSPQNSETRIVPLVIDLHEAELEAELEIPTGPMRLAELAERVLDLSSAVADMLGESAEKNGHKVSCRKGCAACCRALIALSPAEAFLLADLVDTMPEPAQTRVRERFARAEALMKQRGFVERLDRLESVDRSDD